MSDELTKETAERLKKWAIADIRDAQLGYNTTKDERIIYLCSNLVTLFDRLDQTEQELNSSRAQTHAVRALAVEQVKRIDEAFIGVPVISGTLRYDDRRRCDRLVRQLTADALAAIRGDKTEPKQQPEWFCETCQTKVVGTLPCPHLCVRCGGSEKLPEAHNERRGCETRLRGFKDCPDCQS